MLNLLLTLEEPGRASQRKISAVQVLCVVGALVLRFYCGSLEESNTHSNHVLITESVRILIFSSVLFPCEIAIKKQSVHGEVHAGGKSLLKAV